MKKFAVPFCDPQAVHSIFNKQCCQILHACKFGNENTQTLVHSRKKKMKKKSRNKGGMWKVNRKMQAIL